MIFATMQLGHNATVALFNDEICLGVLSQEKVDNVKNSSAFPVGALNRLLIETNLTKDCLKKLVICGKHVHEQFLSSDPNTFEDKSLVVQSSVRAQIKRYANQIGLLDLATWIKFLIRQKNMVNFDQKLLATMVKNGFENDIEIIRFDHHECHAYAAAYFFSDKAQRVIFTLDGEGDGLSGTVSIFDGRKLRRLVAIPTHSSVGFVYSGVTKYLGMKTLEHEYKVMGLAAYAKSPYVDQAFKKLFSNFAKITEQDKGYSISTKIPATDTVQYLTKNASEVRFDNLAGAAQILIENIVCEWITKNIEKTKIRNIATSGGVFMNVKLNKKIQELESVKSVKFLPSCGDESNVLGAGFNYIVNVLNKEPMFDEEMFLGIKPDDTELLSKLSEMEGSGLIGFRECSDINRDIAKLLAEGSIVARAYGQNEWGARSLGNRAILGNPSRMESFYEINDAIKVRDFWMPFAPSILDYRANDYLQNYDENSSYPYSMITAYDATELAKNELRAGTHQGDGTCRPQIVTEAKSPKYYDLLRKFEELTGIGGVLNTSLNIHGYPLAADTDHLFFTLQNSGLNYIAINNFLIWKKVS